MEDLTGRQGQISFMKFKAFFKGTDDYRQNLKGSLSIDF
jgi:hypothetical protein